MMMRLCCWNYYWFDCWTTLYNTKKQIQWRMAASFLKHHRLNGNDQPSKVDAWYFISSISIFSRSGKKSIDWKAFRKGLELTINENQTGHRLWHSPLLPFHSILKLLEFARGFRADPLQILWCQNLSDWPMLGGIFLDSFIVIVSPRRRKFGDGS